MSGNIRKKRTTSAGSKKKNMNAGVRKKGMKESKLNYIGIVLSSHTAGTRFEIAYET
jgi:hypothetical protein